MKLTVSNIDWDYDEDEEPKLPTKIVIDDPDILQQVLVDIDGEAENLADYLTDAYGYCVRGFTTNIEGVNEP